MSIEGTGTAVNQYLRVYPCHEEHDRVSETETFVYRFGDVFDIVPLIDGNTDRLASTAEGVATTKPCPSRAVDVQTTLR